MINKHSSTQRGNGQSQGRNDKPGLARRKFNLNLKIAANSNFGTALSHSNQNLFVFKNGWTSTTNQKSPSGLATSFNTHSKARPMSSNHYGRQRKNLVPPQSNARLWKHQNSNQNEVVASGYFNNTSKNLNKNMSYRDLRSDSTRKQSASFVHQPKLIDKSLKAVLSGKNLLSLTHSAARPAIDSGSKPASKMDYTQLINSFVNEESNKGA